MDTYCKYILLMLIGLLVGACEGNEEYNFYISKYHIETVESVSIAGKKDATTEFNITADCEWTIEGLPTWLSASPSSGHGDATVTLTVENSNPTPSESRNGEFYVSGDNGNIKMEVKVLQATGTSDLSFGRERLDFECYSEEVEVLLSCKGSWNITAPSWLTLSQTEGAGNAQITIGVSNYRGDKPQEGTLYIESADASIEVPVTQDKYTATLEIESENFVDGKYLFEYPEEGGTRQLRISCSDGWLIENIPGWTEFTQTEAAEGGVYRVTVTAKANKSYERGQTIIIKNTYKKDMYKELTIKQAATSAPLLSIAPETLSFSYMESTQKIIVTSREEWKVSSNQDWCKVTKDGEAVTVHVPEYHGVDPREAVVVVSLLSGTHSMQCKVTQQGDPNPQLSIAPETLSFANIASTQKILVTSREEWKVSSNQDWCSVAKDGDAVAVSVPDYRGADPREAVVVVSLLSGTCSLQCKVTQQGGSVHFTSVTVSDVTKHSFKINGSFESDIQVTEYGICLSDATVLPTIANAVYSVSSASTRGQLEKEVTGLADGHTYYVCLYAKNVGGVTYSNVVTVTTPFSTPQEGDNTPPTVN